MQLHPSETSNTPPAPRYSSAQSRRSFLLASATGAAALAVAGCAKELTPEEKRLQERGPAALFEEEPEPLSTEGTQQKLENDTASLEAERLNLLLAIGDLAPEQASEKIRDFNIKAHVHNGLVLEVKHSSAFAYEEYRNMRESDKIRLVELIND